MSDHALYATLNLEPAGESRYLAQNDPHGPVVFGGQMLAQTVIAALEGEEGKRVKTLHTVFARAGRPDQPLEISVDTVHSGRAFGSKSVTISQGDRVISRSSVLLSADEDDFIRHQDSPAPAAPGLNDCVLVDNLGSPWQMRRSSAYDVNDPAEVGPADYDLWVRFDEAPDSAAANQALLAYTTESFLIAAAMRPHDGVGQSQAHVTLSTAVVSHTATFHVPVIVSDWLLISNHSMYAGHGHASTAEVMLFTEARCLSRVVRPRRHDQANVWPGQPLATEKSAFDGVNGGGEARL